MKIFVYAGSADRLFTASPIKTSRVYFFRGWVETFPYCRKPALVSSSDGFQAF